MVRHSSTKQDQRPQARGKAHSTAKGVSERRNRRRASLGKVNNPTGKGGFAEHPELRGTGRPKNEESFTYWFRFFMGLTVKELNGWKDANPDEVRTVAASLAYTRMVNARSDLREFQEIADRVEGKPIKVDLHQTNNTLNVTQNTQNNTKVEVNIHDVNTELDGLIGFRDRLNNLAAGGSPKAKGSRRSDGE